MLQTPGEGDTTELSLFVDEGGWDHPSRLRRYALRVDGFASLRAGAAGGDVLTRPLIFEGDRLVMNVSTSALGWLRVEVRDREGRAIDGLAQDDCVEVFGDDIEQEVRWQGAPDLGRLADTPVRCTSPCATPTCIRLGFGLSIDKGPTIAIWSVR